MHQEGLEPSAYRLEGDCSIRLSYWCTVRWLFATLVTIPSGTR